MDDDLIPIEVHTHTVRASVPSPRFRFPDPASAMEDGALAAGGDFAPSTLIAAYRMGIFPWPHPEVEQLWFSPDPRATLPIGGLHVSRRLHRTLKSGRFRATVDAAFTRVINGCREREEGTWITPSLRDAYIRLHELGWAHSVEAWSEDGTLAGGLYGLGVGAMFGAESMFHSRSDGSKAAMVALDQYARRIGIELIDIQVLTEHTGRMGGVELPRAEYLARLRAALRSEARWLP